MTATEQEWQQLAVTRVLAAIDARWSGTWPEGFQSALVWPFGGSGKRIRPLLVVAAATAVGADDEAAGVTAAAAAVEMVHTYSLVHDDLPCMDDDDLRRGRPTVHKAFDEATAVLVGDALLTEAFAVLAEAALPPERVVALVQTLAAASGHRGMVGGQVGDIAGSRTQLDAVLDIHRRKTGALLSAAAVCGGIAAGAPAPVLAQLRQFGDNIGLAFQLVDDVLDADDDKGPNVVPFLGIEPTLARAELLLRDAIAALDGLPRPERLVWLAQRAVRRNT